MVSVCGEALARKYVILLHLATYNYGPNTQRQECHLNPLDEQGKDFISKNKSIALGRPRQEDQEFRPA